MTDGDCETGSESDSESESSDTEDVKLSARKIRGALRPGEDEGEVGVECVRGWTGCVTGGGLELLVPDFFR